MIEKFSKQDKEYGKDEEYGKGKTILLDYSSPNIAKPFHIGHLKTTIIGNSLYRIYKFLGFKAIGINHLGDYGTQFAKLIEGYERWGNEYDFSENPIDKLAEIYVSMVEFNKIYDLLDVKFDAITGESFYSDKMQEVLDILNKTGKVQESNGAKIIDLEDQGISTPCIIEKANGSSIYATRDLAAILYRARTYDFDKCLYVVGSEQKLHFMQVFAVAKYLGIDKKYTNGLEHVSYGMIRLPEGKMSTRKGNFVKVEDLLNEAISKVNEIMKDRDIENKEEVAKQVGIGAVIFDDLKESRVKDQVFSLNDALNFNGETGPYLQYTIARSNSILEKANFVNDPSKVDLTKLTDEYSMDVVKLISKFHSIVVSACEKNEPSILSRYLLDLAETYSTFYNNNKVICDDEDLQNARLYLTYMTKITLINGLGLLGIECPNKM